MKKLNIHQKINWKSYLALTESDNKDVLLKRINYKRKLDNGSTPMSLTREPFN